MTPGDNGASTPEEDDPFGYLYADGQARGAQPPSGGYGYPNSVSRVRTVGERQYGQQQPPYVPQQQGAYGQPNAHYQAPETLPGGPPPSGRPPAPQPGPGRRGPNTKGLLIGAIAVVAAVVIGIGIAMINGNSDDNQDNQAGGTPTQGQSTAPTPTGSSPATPELKADPGKLQLAGGATTASDVKGSTSGSYIGGLNTVGASVTWTVDIPSDGTYTLFARYNNPGDDQSMTLTVNGKEFGNKFNLSNFTHQSDPAQAWTETYAYPTLNKGANTVSLSCQQGDKCNVLLDQLWLKPGQQKRG
ncbi:CBM35 domain-containing protein [Streptomyces sp. NPDC048106]|uniref:CBM35 domain-containing protein n=1 Tax=Streptomyces sp. NPDC048106 TaxID=3155750 RepID=UPI003452D0B5